MSRNGRGEGFLRGAARGSERRSGVLAFVIMRIGCDGGPKDSFTGKLDELRIYTRAFDDGEISALPR